MSNTRSLLPRFVDALRTLRLDISSADAGPMSHAIRAHGFAYRKSPMSSNTAFSRKVQELTAAALLAICAVSVSMARAQTAAAEPVTVASAARPPLVPYFAPDAELLQTF
ncbi:MAG: hypothetical protein JWQ11_733, partial [Rhizobacter sp.]|nr:hypothetical protein [Rhizobacter sp.]